MGSALRIIGGLWAAIGVVNLIMAGMGIDGTSLSGAALMGNVITFFVPGLLLIIVGELTGRKKN